MEDLYSQPKFAEAFRLGGFRLELHYYCGCAENEYEVRLLDLADPSANPMRLRVSECRILAIGLRYLEAVADARNGIGNAERTVERLKPLADREYWAFDAAPLDDLMKKLDRCRRRHNRRIDAERERVARQYREEQRLRGEASS